MKFLATALLLLISSLNYSAAGNKSVAHSNHMVWGANGHRIVGEIAYTYLTPKARARIKEILGNESLAMVSNHMDFIKSDGRFKKMSPWHYSTIPDGMTYEDAGTPPEQDVIVTIRRLIKELDKGKTTDGDEAFALKMLVHLIGDIHQPLHVGNGMDKGGNEVDVVFFWEPSNLHRVWDEGIIEQQKLSYTEYTNWINHATKDQVEKWQDSDVMDWAQESYSYRKQVYDLPEDKKINYRYIYKNLDLLNRRLLQAGIRLAGVLNEIYD